MSEEIKVTETVIPTVETETKKDNTKEPEQFKFFKNCSATLKKLSVAVFVINLFLIVIAAVLGVVMVGMYVGFEVVAMLAVPFISVIAILVIFARLVSALIYGFAEIVEKHE
jgi:hypothetical protein